jgi:hypothetical protein
MPGQAGEYQSYADQQGTAQQMLDFLNPQGISDVERQAVMGQLNQGAQQEAVQRASSLQAQGYGAGGSGTALALKARAGQQLAMNQAGAEAGLQQQANERMMGARTLAAQMAQERAGQTANYGLQANQFDLGRYQQLSGEDWQRTMADYEANKMAPYRANVAHQMALAQMVAGDKAGAQALTAGIVGGGLGAVSSFYTGGLMGGGGGGGGDDSGGTHSGVQGSMA